MARRQGWRRFFRGNTNRTAWGAIIAAVAGAVGGAVDPITAAQTGIGALLFIFLREGVRKSGPEAEKKTD